MPTPDPKYLMNDTSPVVKMGYNSPRLVSRGRTIRYVDIVDCDENCRDNSRDSIDGDGVKMFSARLSSILRGSMYSLK